MAYMFTRRPPPTNALLCIVTLLFGFAGNLLYAEDTPPEETVTLNLQKADIRVLINTVADMTGKSFVVDPRVKGNVTVISSAATSVDSLYDVFLSILKVHGFVAVPAGDVIKIIPDATAKQTGGDLTADGQRRYRDEIVTAVIPVEHAEAAGLVPILRPLLPQEAHLAAHANSNVLVGADTAGNIRRLMEVIEELDVPPTEYDIEVVELEYAIAADIVDLVEKVMPKKAKAGSNEQPLLTADPRTNTLLLAGPTQRRLRLRSLIKLLDVPVDEDGTIEVIYLKFAAASELAGVVRGIFGGGTSQRRAAAGANTQQGAAAGTGNARSGRIQIQADESTNALILQGSPADLKRARAIIAQLDIRRSQVLVEGIIAEVSNIASDELGIQWQTSQPGTSNGAFAGTLFPGVNSGAIDDPFDDTLGSPIGTGLTLGLFRAGNIRALLRALESDSYTNVLSTPSLVTLDNAEAEILVGQNVPFVTGQFTNNATTPDNPFQTIERQDVGVILRVSPQVNEGDTVTMEIEQEVSSIAPSTTGSDLITNERSIVTTVLVDDGETIVLGGLIQDDLRESEQKVPFIGNLPVIGSFFKNSVDDVTKSNLMVFLRPTILRTPERATEVTERRIEHIREVQEEQNSKIGDIYPNKKGPQWEDFDGLLD
ncbi:MAG: type II secretion system secretin GspD [Pseudomonadota bacterium]